MKNMEIEHLWNILLEGAPYTKKYENECIIFVMRDFEFNLLFWIFLPQKPLKEQEMNNNYDMWVISGLFVEFINFQQQ